MPTKQTTTPNLPLLLKNAVYAYLVEFFEHRLYEDRDAAHDVAHGIIDHCNDPLQLETALYEELVEYYEDDQSALEVSHECIRPLMFSPSHQRQIEEGEDIPAPFLAHLQELHAGLEDLARRAKERAEEAGRLLSVYESAA